jgi:hypothetical protein
MVRQWCDLQPHLHLPASRQAETAAARFERLAAEWRSATAHQSSVTQRSMHPSYQEIIALGPPAIPLILRTLDRTEEHWFWALRVLCGVDPVPPEEAGNVPAMRAAWLEWGRQRGYLE